MPESLVAFESSLRDYLIDRLSDSTNTPQSLSYRFNNLKVYMDPNKIPDPHFYVSLQISEASFNIDKMEKIEGSLRDIERFVVKWLSKPNINGELKKQWMILTKALAENSINNEHSEELEEKLRIANLNSQTIRLLGTGMKSRFSGFERNRQRRREWQSR